MSSTMEIEELEEGPYASLDAFIENPVALAHSRL